MAERSKRHHFVPRLILRGFAKDDRVMTYDRDTGKTYPQSVERAAAENDYNSLELEDGTLSDAAERAISNLVEGPAAAVLDRLARGGWFKNEAERMALARLVAFQFLRVPGTREKLDAMHDQLLKLDMAAGGPARVREVLANQFGREPTDEEVRRHWESVKDFDEWTVNLPREYHVQESLDMVDEFTPVLARVYGWNLMTWERRHLLTSDAPLLLCPPLQGSPRQPAGLYTAGSIYMTISRSAALVIVNRGDNDGLDGCHLAGTFADARRINQLTALFARQWVYFNPDDNLDDLLGEGWELPPSQPISFDNAHSIDLRDRLKIMGEWAYDHPDEPHPFMGPSRFQPPWSDEPSGT